MSAKLRMTRAAWLSLAVATCIAASGCFTSVLRSGAPVGPAPAEFDEKWHSGLIYGLVELSGPYDLARVCPNGWAEIRTETSFVNGLVQWVTWNIYNPQTVTVRCAAGGPVPPPPAPPPAAAPPR